MMRYTDTHRQHAAAFICALMGLVGMAAVPAFAERQLEVRTVYSVGQAEPGVDSSAKLDAISVNLDYKAGFKVSPHGEILVQEAYTGIGPLYGDSVKEGYDGKVPAPFQERMTGSFNNAALGLRFTGLGIAELSGRSLFYINAPVISPERLNVIPPDTNFFSLSSTMKRRMLTQVDGSWALPLGPVDIDLGANLISRHYEREIHWKNKNSDVDTLVEKPFIAERELWSDVGFAYRSPIDVDVTLDARLKNNFGGYPRDNIYRYEGGLRGTHSFPSNNKVNWVLVERLYNMKFPLKYLGDHPDDPDMAYHYMVHPYTRFMIRDVYTLAWGLFLKGTVILDGGQNYFKDRYEGSLRKAWEGGSSIEGGYFAALRGLAPAQGCYARGTVRMADWFALSGAVKNRWEYQAFEPVDGETTTTSGKFNSALLSCNLEGSFALVKDMEVLLGMDWNRYRYYSSEKYANVRTEFPSRVDAYMGFRACIR